jgi:aldose sugar dehydrogenase
LFSFRFPCSDFVSGAIRGFFVEVKQMFRMRISWVVVGVLLAVGCNRGVQPTSEESLEQPRQTTHDEQRNSEPVLGGKVFKERIETEEMDIRLVEVAGPFEHPWGMAFLPDGRILVTERPGRLKLVSDESITDISGLPQMRSQSQGGLLDVSLHPDYENNGWIYLTYSKPGEGNHTATALSRARLDGQRLTDLEEIFVQDRFSTPGRHYGSRLAWSWDGTLLMSIGDRGSEPPRAQDTADHAGSLLRLNDDGSAADGNPFAGADESHDEIYALGLRNIQGMVIDKENQRIWVADHGPRGGDELNLIERGENYGWPLATRGRDYRTGGPFPGSQGESLEGMVDPVHYFIPAHPPSGLALVTSEHFPDWNGDLLMGGLASQSIRRLSIDDRTVSHDEEILKNAVGRIRDVRQGPDGFIYLLVDASDGKLYRIEPAR